MKESMRSSSIDNNGFTSRHTECNAIETSAKSEYVEIYSKPHPLRYYEGFTLIELMIVIAIIAIIAAISIPSILQASKGANERNAAESVRSLAKAQNIFKNEHASGKFWIGDVFGFWRIKSRTGADVVGIKLIDTTVANADGLIVAAPVNTGVDQIEYDATLTPPAAAQAKSGYLFRQLLEWQDALTTQSYNVSGTQLNPTRWGFITYPQIYGQGGRTCFKLETVSGGKVYKRDPGSGFGAASFTPPTSYTRWENDVIAAGWSGSE